MTGAVTWFDNGKGYGFLKRDGGADVFCHYSQIQSEGYKALNEGDVVEFEIGADVKGKPYAVKVVRVTEGYARGILPKLGR